MLNPVIFLEIPSVFVIIILTLIFLNFTHLLSACMVQYHRAWPMSAFYFESAHVQTLHIGHVFAAREIQKF